MQRQPARSATTGDKSSPLTPAAAKRLFYTRSEISCSSYLAAHPSQESSSEKIQARQRAQTIILGMKMSKLQVVLVLVSRVSVESLYFRMTGFSKHVITAGSARSHLPGTLHSQSKPQCLKYCLFSHFSEAHGVQTVR